MKFSKKTTVKFNVGGSIFEVAQSLLDRFPNTMLSRMASETWNPAAAAPKEDEEENGLRESSNGNEITAVRSDGGSMEEVQEEALFIERDSQRFRFILDYMRDGKMSLPSCEGSTVTRESMKNELLYYGFEDVPETAIRISNLLVFPTIYNLDSLIETAQEEKQKMKQETKSLCSQKESIQQQLNVLERQLDVIHYREEATDHAIHVVKQMKAGEIDSSSSSSSSSSGVFSCAPCPETLEENNQLYNMFISSVSKEEKQRIYEESFALFGLKIKRMDDSVVKVEELAASS